MMSGGPPLGICLANAAKVVSRAFDRALADAGGSRPVWLVLMAVRANAGASQQELAARIGIRAATLTHHLAGMEAQGLVERTRGHHDRRNQTVRLRPEGERLFEALRAAAQRCDRRLRSGLTEDDQAVLRRVLARLERNVSQDNLAPDSASSDHTAGGTCQPT